MGFKHRFWALGPIDRSKEAPRNESSGHARGGRPTRCTPGTLPGAASAGGLGAWLPGAAWCWLAGWLLCPHQPHQPRQTRSAQEVARRPVQRGNVGSFLAKSPHIPRCVGAVEPCGAGTGDFARLQPAPPPASLQALFSRKPSSVQVEIQGRAIAVVSASGGRWISAARWEGGRERRARGHGGLLRLENNDDSGNPATMLRFVCSTATGTSRSQAGSVGLLHESGERNGARTGEATPTSMLPGQAASRHRGPLASPRPCSRVGLHAVATRIMTGRAVCVPCPLSRVFLALLASALSSASLL